MQVGRSSRVASWFFDVLPYLVGIMLFLLGGLDAVNHGAWFAAGVLAGMLLLSAHVFYRSWR